MVSRNQPKPICANRHNAISQCSATATRVYLLLMNQKVPSLFWPHNFAPSPADQVYRSTWRSRRWARGIPGDVDPDPCGPVPVAACRGISRDQAARHQLDEEPLQVQAGREGSALVPACVWAVRVMLALCGVGQSRVLLVGLAVIPLHAAGRRTSAAITRRRKKDQRQITKKKQKTPPGVVRTTQFPCCGPIAVAHPLHRSA